MTSPERSRAARQWAALHRIVGRIRGRPEFLGAILLGSLATDHADEMSDIDLFVVVDGDFQAAWRRRDELHGDDVLRSTSRLKADMPSAAGYSWLTRELIMVESVVTTLDSGARIAEPFVVIAGPKDLADRLPRRSPIDRSEMKEGGDDLESTYDALKVAVRRRPNTPPASQERRRADEQSL